MLRGTVRGAKYRQAAAIASPRAQRRPAGGPGPVDGLSSSASQAMHHFAALLPTAKAFPSPYKYGSASRHRLLIHSTGFRGKYSDFDCQSLKQQFHTVAHASHLTLT